MKTMASVIATAAASQPDRCIRSDPVDQLGVEPVEVGSLSIDRGMVLRAIPTPRGMSGTFMSATLHLELSSKV